MIYDSSLNPRLFSRHHTDELPMLEGREAMGTFNGYGEYENAPSPNTESIGQDFSRVTLKANLAEILRRDRDVHPTTLLERIMGAIPVGSYPPKSIGDDVVERVAEVLWSQLDLNGHTIEGVRRAARAALTAATPALSEVDKLLTLIETAHEHSDEMAIVNQAEVVRTLLGKDTRHGK